MQWRRLGTSAALACLVGGWLLLGGGPSGPTNSSVAFASQPLSFTVDDGVTLHASVGSFGALTSRPLIVEDSPYAPDVSTLDWSGGAYNYVELQWRGTGLSAGSLDSTGSRDQKDLQEFLGWACSQSWSNGNIGLYGFSASAIIVYNSMHLTLPCVKAASLMSGTNDLYRDLLYIGGVPSPVVGSAVEGLILAPWLENLVGRAQASPVSVATSLAGLATAPIQVGQHMTEDAFWQERSFQGDANQFPVLADDGFYDVEERGAFQGYLNTKSLGSHLIVMGAHDGSPAGVSPFPEYSAWFDHYVAGVDNGVQNQPVVQALLSNGSREQFLADNVTAVTGSDWPLPNANWTDLYLSATKSGSVSSINDGSLSFAPDQLSSLQQYPFVPSVASETDVHSIAAVAGDGIDQFASVFPQTTDLDVSAPTSLTYTTPPLRQAVDAVGPVGLDLYASTTAPVTDLVAVVADVWPDGTAYPVATGWLRSSYPHIDATRTLTEQASAGGTTANEIVDPYADFSTQELTPPLSVREYHIEVLPIGNHFAAGHRIRLYILGTPIDMQGSPPGLNAVSLGGLTLSRLIFPTVGTTLAAAIGQ